MKCRGHAYAIACMWKSEDKFVDSVLSFNLQIQIVRIAQQSHIYWHKTIIVLLCLVLSTWGK